MWTRTTIGGVGKTTGDGVATDVLGFDPREIKREAVRETSAAPEKNKNILEVRLQGSQGLLRFRIPLEV